MLKQFHFKCTHCTFENKQLNEVRKHMDFCSAIDGWVERGCDVSKINPMFVKNIDHWTGQKIGGALFNQNFKQGNLKNS